MRGGGAEAIKTALWRSRWLLLALMVLGAASFNLFSQFRGPEYSATSQVLISHTDLAGALTGSQSAYIAPERLQETELALANSSELYQRVAADADGVLGTAPSLQDHVSVSGKSTNDVLYFTATASRPALAVEISNRVAAGYAAWRGEVAAQPIKTAITSLLTRIAEDGTSADLQQNLERLRVLETLTTGNAQVVERATAGTKTRPDPVRDSAVGLALGLLFGLVVIAASELLNTTIRSEADVEEALGITVAGSTPQFPRGTKGLVVTGNDRARFEDAYSLLSAEVERESVGVGQGAVVAVTSAAPGEGKSSTASNLATVLAQNGHRCLLIDFDLRRPSVAALFGIPNKTTGVQEIVREHEQPAGCLWRAEVDRAPVARPASPLLGANEGAVSTLDVLPSGGSRGPLRSKADFERMREVIRALRSDYDWIIIDTPPALRTTEVSQIAPVTDAVLVVARYGLTSRRLARSLKRKLGGWRTKSVTSVLVGLPRREDPAGYYAYASDG